MQMIFSLMIVKDDNILCECSEGVMCIYEPKNNSIITNYKKVKERNPIFTLVKINDHQFLSCCNNKIVIWEY